MSSEQSDLKELRRKIKEQMIKIEELAIAVNSKLSANRHSSLLRPDGHASRKIKLRRKLRGHLGKVVSVTWLPDSRSAVTASQDGNVIVWDAIAGRKKYLVPLKSAWVMFAEANSDQFQPMIVTGGLDNVATLWQCPTAADPTSPMLHEFFGHTGCVCAATFVDRGRLITTSGDHTAGLWDVTRAIGIGAGAKSATQVEDERICIFRGHDQDVTSIDHDPLSKKFVTSSADGSCMLWDTATDKPEAVMRLFQQDIANGAKPSQTKQLRDVNRAKFQTNGVGVGIATEEMGCYLYDIRTLCPVNTFGCRTTAADEELLLAKHSCAFSRSGRLLFTAGSDLTLEVWDTLQPDAKKPLHTLCFHESRVTDVAVPADGQGCGTASWDSVVGIIAP